MSQAEIQSDIISKLDQELSYYDQHASNLHSKDIIKIMQDINQDLGGSMEIIVNDKKNAIDDITITAKTYGDKPRYFTITIVGCRIMAFSDLGYIEHSNENIARVLALNYQYAHLMSSFGYISEDNQLRIMTVCDFGFDSYEHAISGIRLSIATFLISMKCWLYDMNILSTDENMK